jgi:hypothetical protein
LLFWRWNARGESPFVMKSSVQPAMLSDQTTSARHGHKQLQTQDLTEM